MYIHILPALPGWSQDAALPAQVNWQPQTGSALARLATSALLDEDLFHAVPLRKGHRYPRQRNYHGYYYFSQTRRHIWHESLLEAATLRWLDMHADIVAIAAQPVELRFADGSRHIPDYLALHADHSQVLYDVKPRKFISPGAELQFANTMAACQEVGWKYEVRTDLPEQVALNLKWLSAFKHHAYYPGDEVAFELLDALPAECTVRAAADMLDVPSLAVARSTVYHLVWAGLFSTDLTIRLNDTALLRKAPHAHP